MPRSNTRSAVILLSLSLVVVAAVAWAEPESSLAGEPDEKYVATTRELLESTGALNLGLQMADGVVQAMLQQMQASGNPPPLRVAEILRETSRDFFGQIFGDADETTRFLARVYAKHFTQSEIEGLLVFYRTPLGQKTIQAMPSIMAEGMAFGQSKAAASMPEFQAEFARRLQAEGLIPGP
jgi:hypothetical protein